MTRAASRARAARTSRSPVAVLVPPLLALAGCTAAASGAPDPASGTATPTSALVSMTAEDGPIEPGIYRIPSSDWSVADFTVTIPKGWEVQAGHVYTKNLDEPDEIGFYAVVVDTIFTDACEGEGVPLGVGPGVSDLVTALRAQEGPTASDPVEATLGGHPATRIELTVPNDLDLDSCRLEGAGLQVWYSTAADKHFVLLPQWIAQVYVLDIDDERQVFVTTHRPTTSKAALAELQAVLDSIHIES